MKVALLAGGVGSRLSEETIVKPKPMVEVGGRPILWHIMKLYACQGFTDFSIALGYKGEYIKRYMVDYASLNGDLRVTWARRASTQASQHEPTTGPCSLIDTGQDTLTGGRIKRWLLPGRRDFHADLGRRRREHRPRTTARFHRSHGKLATVTAVRPPARFGRIELDGDRSQLSPRSRSSARAGSTAPSSCSSPASSTTSRATPRSGSANPWRARARRQLMAYKHDGFWQCMDTLRDKKLLESLWESGNAPWKIWE